MKVVFLTNTYNHHQSQLAAELYRRLGGDYHFIQTLPMTDERIKLGWKTEVPSYVLSYYDESEKGECIKLIDGADLVITGSAPNSLLKKRLLERKLVFRYSERLYKNWKKYFSMPIRFFKYHLQDYFSKNVYLLAASAYAKTDYSLTLNYYKKIYKYGYFPYLAEYKDVSGLIANKRENSILWVGRMLKWKHPEYPVLLAEKLKIDGFRFHISMAGTGPCESEIRTMIAKKNLTDCVSMIGATSPSEVRKLMERSQIFIFTSDQNEGWGAVLNESMNSCCAVVANNTIGSVPFLLSNNYNGLIYRNKRFKDFCECVKLLLLDSKLRERIGATAYQTIFSEWNAKNVADRVLLLAQSILDGNKNPNLFDSGVLSKC